MLKIFGEGRLAKDATLFTYPSQNGDKTGVNFDVIFNTDYYNEETAYIRCTMFNRGQSFADMLTMGNQVIVSGRLDVQVSDDGNRYNNIIVEEFSFGAKKQGSYNSQSNKDQDSYYENKQKNKGNKDPNNDGYYHNL